MRGKPNKYRHKQHLLRGAFVAVLTLAAVPTMAADASKLHKIEQQLDEQKQKQAELDRATREAGEGVAALRQQLVQATEALEGKATEENRLEEKLDALTEEMDKKKKSLAEQKQRLRAFTAALIEMARQPLISFFLRSGLTSDYVHRSILVREMMPHLKDDVLAMGRDLVALGQMRGELDAQRDLVASARENLEAQQKDIDQLVKVRQGKLQRTEAEREAIAKKLAALSTEAKDLRQLLEKIAPKQKEAPPSSGNGKGIKWPVNGSIAHRFGDRDADGVVSQGMTFSALSGSPIVAPASGKVVFAGPFRGYGQIVILQHAGGFHSFLAGFGRIDADMGQEVDGGEPIGVLPTGSARRSELYFEWRKNSEPIDPATGITLLKNH